jgi:hypothetical protein
MLEFDQTFKEVFQYFSNFYKVEKARTLPNSFYKTSITLISKPGKDEKKTWGGGVARKERRRKEGRKKNCRPTS